MEEIDIAIEAARHAGHEILDIYTRPKRERDPNDNDKLTQADILANRLIIARINAIRPTHPILSEEQTESESQIMRRMDGVHLWVIDPLDGTSGFFNETDDFSIHIAYVREGVPLAAVVYQPALDKLYCAELGAGARLIQTGKPEQKLAVSTRPLEQAVLLLSRKDNVDQQVEETRQYYGAATVQKKDSFGVKAGLVAEGKAEIYINDSKKAAIWDSCAPGLILTEAGGIITDLKGRRIETRRKSPYLPAGALCTTPTLFPEILRRVQQRYSNL